jgi:hypothetical protein
VLRTPNGVGAEAASAAVRDDQGIGNSRF